MGEMVQLGAKILSFQPVEAKLLGFPRASLCAPLGPPGLCPRGRRGVGLRPVPFDAVEPPENNAQESVVWPHPLLFPRAPQTVPRAPFQLR